MLHLPIRNSRIDFALALLIHCSAFYAVAISHISLLVQLSIAMPIAVSLFYRIRRWRIELPERITALGLSRSRCMVYTRAGGINVSPPTIYFFSEFLLILQFSALEQARFAEHHGRLRKTPCEFRVVLFPDSLSADDDRKLRRSLRFELA